MVRPARLLGVQRVCVSTQSLVGAKARAASSLPDFLPGRWVGHYQVVSCLGAGWEGRVYRVRDSRHRSHVLKVYRRQALASGMSWRTRLRHLRRVHGFGSGASLRLVHRCQAWQGVLLPYQPGESLCSMLAVRRNGALSLREARLAFLAILRALARLHERGAYHGDLHEGNILLVRCGLGYRASFIDPLPQPGAVRALQERDLVEAVRVFAWMLGGRARYSRHPAWVRQILCGLQSRRILARHRSVTELFDAAQR